MRFQEARDLLVEALGSRREYKQRLSTGLPLKQDVDSSAKSVHGLLGLSIELNRNNLFHRLPDSERVLAAKLVHHSSVDEMMADLLNNLAACEETLGNLVEAAKLYEESIALRKVSCRDALLLD